MPFRDVVLALVVVLIWGCNFVAVKWGVALLPPLLLTGLRYVCAVFPAILFVRRPNVSIRLLIGYGLAVGAAQFGLLFLAIKLGMPAGLASLVLQTQVFFTIPLAAILLGERLTPLQLVGALVALLGIFAIGLERFQSTALVPLLMVLGAAFCWGLANIMTKRAGQVDMLGFVVWSSLVPPLPLFALSFLVEGPAAIVSSLQGINATGLGVIFYNGLGSTLIGYGLWSVLMKRHKASAVAPFSLLVPVVGLACGLLVLGEPMTPVEIGGSALVFLGLVTNVFGPRLFRGPQPIEATEQPGIAS